MKTMLVFTVFSVAMFAQDTKSAEPPETPEHLYVRNEIGHAVEYNKEMRVIVGQYGIELNKCMSPGQSLNCFTTLDDSVTKANIRLYQRLHSSDWPRGWESHKGASSDDVNNFIALLESKLKVVDSCKKVYDTTVDMKTSDLTTRQTDLINGCKLLTIYPPQTH